MDGQVRAPSGDVVAQVPATVVREGKIPAAWFLEQVGSKGARHGDIQVATYHANLIYNDGAGTARDLCALIADLKERVGYEARPPQPLGHDLPPFDESLLARQKRHPRGTGPTA